MGNMTLEQGIAYGKKIGCKYFLYNGKYLYGGYTTLKAAQKGKKELEKKFNTTLEISEELR